MSHARDPSVDVLRGVAILTMVEANMAPYVLVAPHPPFLRAIGTFAAPTFVFLAGMMVSISRRPAKMGHALRRSALLLFVAAAIDVGCWHIAPFEDFDVLYLIGVALPIAALCLELDARLHAFVAFSFVALAPIVRHRFGYGPLLADPSPWPLWRRWLVDGWFPVFPWLGVSLFGSWYGRVRERHSPRTELIGGTSMALLGLLAVVVEPPVLVTRHGYSELFYPPTLGVLATALGASLVVLSLVPRLPTVLPLSWIGTYGRASLVVYVAHTVFIAFAFVHVGPQSLGRFLGLYACHVAVLWGIARLRATFAPALRRDGLRSGT